MSRRGRWLSNILAVLFTAAVMGVSVVVILQEGDTRWQASPAEAAAAVEPVAVVPPDVDEEPAAGPQVSPDILDILDSGDSGGRHLHPPTASEHDRFIAQPESAVPAGTKTIHTLPRTRDELATAFERAKEDRCELLPPGEPLELTSFAPYLTDRDRLGAVPAVPSLRRGTFSVGLRLSSEEQGRLPALSRGKIVDYIDGHFVSVQARVRRDPLSRIQYLHHRPLAAVAKYSGVRVTQPAEPAIASSVDDFRSLGLLVDPDQSIAVADLRTLVIIHRHDLLHERPSGAPERRPDYELAFIHARSSDSAGIEPPALHSFVTSDGRSRLHHLRSLMPTHAGACDIRADVRLTEFTHAGMYPTQAVVRDVHVADKAAYGIADLDTYVRSREWSGDTWDQLPKLFDAIIDKKIR